MLLYPRLPHSFASSIALELMRLDMPSIQARANNKHDAQYYTATGGNRALSQQMAELREKVLGYATANGFPNSDSSEDQKKFDLMCAIELHKSLLITPNEASSGEVWQFITCVLMPDVVAWRFRSSSGISIERYLGGNRNTFRRLWWRAYLFYDAADPEPYSLLEALNEDEMVQITERPGVSGNPAVCKQLCESFMEICAARAIKTRMTLMREAMKLVRRKTAVISLDGLTPAELGTSLDMCFVTAANSLLRQDNSNR